MKFRWVSTGVAAVVLTAVSAVAAGQVPALGMLDQLEQGRWELRVRGETGANRQLCVRDGRELIQLRHAAATCSRHIVDDTAAEVTIQYTCRGAGYGRTTVRRETNRLVQIDSQGIAEGLPFAFMAEARRVGNCAD